MKIETFSKSLKSINPILVKKKYFIRAINSKTITAFNQKHIFDCNWSFTRGYRYNYKNTVPTLYLASNHTVASTELGPHTYSELIAPFALPYPPFLYFTVEVTAKVLDLADFSIVNKLGINKEDLLISTNKWQQLMDNGKMALTHLIGKAVLKDKRFDGILFPPYPLTQYGIEHNYHNCAIFMDKKSKYMAKPINKRVVLSVIDEDALLKKLGVSIS